MTAVVAPVRWRHHGIDIAVIVTPTEIRWAVRDIARALADNPTADALPQGLSTDMPAWTVDAATPYIRGRIPYTNEAVPLLQWLEDETHKIQTTGNSEWIRLTSRHSTRAEEHGYPAVLPTYYDIVDAATILSRDPAIFIDRSGLYEQMLHAGMITRSGASYRADEAAVLAELVSLQLRPSETHAYPQIVLTVDGIRALHKRLAGVAPIQFTAPTRQPQEATS